MLLRNNDDQELVSREKKDRRDFEQLSALATRMGLHRYFNLILSFECFFNIYFRTHAALIDIVLYYSGSRQYAKIIVFSKDPLPNYRPDLDDKRPQREVFTFSFSNLLE